MVTALPEPTTLGEDLEHSTRAIATRLTSSAVVDRASLLQAVTDRQDLGDRMKQVVAFFEPFKTAANKLHKSICARERDVLAPLEAIDKRLAGQIADFKRAEDDRRRAEERERQERDRVAREQRAADEAAALERAGHTAMADAVLEHAIAAPTPTVVLPDVTSGVKGLSFMTVWKWRPAGGDTPANRARAVQVVPREYLALDDARLTAYAKAMKSSANVPGLEFYADEVPVRRGGRS